MSRALSRTAVRLTCLLAAVGLITPATALGSTSGDPGANRELNWSTRSYCQENPDGSNCISSALSDINAARAAEGVRRMVLPSNFASMSVPVQLLNLANLERVDRGLVPILGLSAALNRDAQAGAEQDADPMPSHFYGDTATSNWAGGDDSALEADFDWMYDDGPGSGNLDCTSAGESGCWGHRHDILWRFSSPIAMGAGSATGQYGASMTELFVGGDTQTGPGRPDAPVVRPSQSASVASGSPAGGATGPRGRVTTLKASGSALAVGAGCSGVNGTLCKLSVTVTVGTHRQPVSVYVRAGHSRVVRIALDRTARKLLATGRALPVHVVVRQGGLTLLTRTLTLGARA